MKREIKFRAKDKDTNEWLAGNLLQDDYGNCCLVGFIDHHETWYDVVAETVGQFTERYDTKLNEIFENDIVRVNIGDAEIICIVKWNKDVGAWCLLINGDTQIGVKPLGSFLCDIRYRIEVIGNIYDNSNLLEE